VARDKNALDRPVSEGAEALGMLKRLDQRRARIAVSQAQDMARVVGGRARLSTHQLGEKRSGLRPQPFEGHAQLVEIRAAPGRRRAVSWEVHDFAGALSTQLVAGDEFQVRGVR